MTIWEAVAVCVAGLGAGALNTVVGSGTLITFPVLLAVGLPPVTANVSNALGLVPGSVSGAIGYRRELRGQRRRVLVLGAVAFAGAMTGAALLVALPSSAFDMIVPALIGVAVLVVVLQPWLARLAERHRRKRGAAARPNGGVPLSTGMLFASTYGGYFGAAQGIIYLALMGLFLDEDLQRINAVKNVLGALVNGTAAAFFLFVADFDWTAVLLVAAGDRHRHRHGGDHSATAALRNRSRPARRPGRATFRPWRAARAGRRTHRAPRATPAGLPRP